MQGLSLLNLSAAVRYSSFSLAVLLTACGGSGDTDSGVTANAKSEVAKVQDTSSGEEQNTSVFKTGMAINASQEATLVGKAGEGTLPSTLLASTTACPSSAWTQGKYYSAGSIVYYPKNGKYYRASYSNPGYDPTISTWYWTIYTCSSTSTSTSTPTSVTSSVVSPVSSVSTNIVSELQFNQMFPNRNAFYSYAGFAAAVNSLIKFVK